MNSKYPSMYYTTKFTKEQARVVEAPTTGVEWEIFHLVTLGNVHYVARQYRLALEAYLAAHQKLPVVVWPWLGVPPIGIIQLAEFMETIQLQEVIEARVAQLLGDGSITASPTLPLPPPAPIDPVPEIFELAGKLGVKVPATGVGALLDRGLELIQQGSMLAARQTLREAAQLVAGEPELALSVELALAATGASTEPPARTAAAFKRARDRAPKREPASTLAAVTHNEAIALTLAGKDAEAGELLASSLASMPPVHGLHGVVHHKVNPGIESVSRDLGAQPSYVLRDSSGTWKAVEIGIDKDPTAIVAGTTLVEPSRLGTVAGLQAELLAPRVGATTLAELYVPLHVAPQFVAYLSHVAGFVLPLALGDTYAALGDYERAITWYLKARDYQWLNQAIERPMLWTRLARVHLRRGLERYRNRDMAGAGDDFGRIVSVGAGGAPQFLGALYGGGFAGLDASHGAFLLSADRVGFEALDYDRRLLLLQAWAYSQQVSAGINYLGFPDDIVPIHTWRYLQNLARYLCNQAMQAERAYISFRDSAERDEATRRVLSQAVDAQQVALEVENQRVEASAAQAGVAAESAKLAEIREANANERVADFEATSKELAVLEEINGWATGPMDNAELNEAWGSVLGIPPGEYDTYQVVRLVARERAQVSHAYELRDKARAAAEAAAHKAVADAQVAVADEMLDVVKAQHEVAELRVAQAEERLAAFDAEEFVPELWHELADAQREIADRYLDMAISTAFLMERAFEAEYDLEVDRIRFDYARSELQGLLSADFLLADIDQFAFDRVLHTQKFLPFKVTISLAGRYPRDFFSEFRKTGVLAFQTLLEDFDREHPGAHLRKLKRVEVVVEGTVGRQGIRGWLRNGGISSYRDRQGDVRIRVQRAEVLPLSQYNLRRDGFVFTADEGVLQVFENAGVAAGWELDLAAERNDLDLDSVQNVHVVFYFDAIHSPEVEERVLAELAATDLQQHQVGYRLRTSFPDAFFGFQDTGSVEIELDRRYLPRHHVDPTILDLHVWLLTDDPAFANALVVQVDSGAGLSVQQALIDGLASSLAPGAALVAARGAGVADTWILSIPEAANAAAFAAGFTWEGVKDMVLVAEYQHASRRGPALGGELDDASLASFEVVDVPGASNGPSSWNWDAAEGEIVQTTNIHAGAGGAEMPGSLLLGRTDQGWPELADGVVSAQLRSTDDDGIGVVFRYQNSSNYSFVMLDRQQGIRRIGRVQGGAFHELTPTATQVTPDAFEVGTSLTLQVAVVGNAIAVAVDGELVLSAVDPAMASEGRVGVLSRANIGARFSSFRTRRL